MKIIKISIAKGATVNLGNYESARIDVSFELQLDIDDDNVDDGITLLSKRCNNFLRNQVDDIEQSAGVVPRGTERFTGKG